jgi:hypothetical protein
MTETQKGFYRGWGELAAYIADVHNNHGVIVEAAAEFGIEPEHLEESGLNENDVAVLKDVLGDSQP